MLPDSKLLESIFLQSFNAIAITNADFDNLKFEYINPTFLELTGYSYEEIIGKSPKILQGEKTKRKEIKRLKKLCQNGRVFKGKNINYKKDGTKYWVEWVVSPIKDEKGNITNYLSIQKDVSHEKRLEKKLVKNIKLNTLNAISAGLTHDLNSSLTTIKGATEILELEIESLDNTIKENLSVELKTLVNGINEISSITNSLHHITGSEVKIENQVNIFAVLTDAINTYKEKITKFTTCVLNGHNAFEENGIHYKEFYANIDQNSIHHVFMILIDNFLEDLINKGNKKNSLFKIKIKQKTNKMYIDFTNNADVKYKNLAKVFNPEFQDKKFGASGIGLHVAKNIIQDLRGEIKVISNPPETTFRVIIPL